MTRDEQIDQFMDKNPGVPFCFECIRVIDKDQQDISQRETGLPMCGFCLAVYLVQAQKGVV